MAEAIEDNDAGPKRRFTVTAAKTLVDALGATGLPAIGEVWDPFRLRCIGYEVTVNAVSDTRWTVICKYGPA